MTTAGDPRLLSLANGLAGLADQGGGTPLPQGPSEPATPPIQAPPSLTDLYMKARVAGMDDTNAALAVAQHLRQQADLRSGFREAGDVAAGRPFDGGAYRAQLMGEADRPLQDLAARRATGPLAMEEAKRRGELASADIGAQQAAQLRDPNHPTNIAMRQAFTRMGLTPPPGLTVAALPKEMWETVKPLAELTGKREGIVAEAPLKASETKKNLADASQTTALTGPKVAETSAGAAKAAAEAAVEAQKLGGQVAPGWRRTGTVANVSDKETQDFRTQAAGADESDRITRELIAILGKRDFPTTPTKVARAAVLSGKLLAAGKNAMGIRGLPAQDVQYLQSMQGDLSAGSVKNWLHLNQNVARLKELNRNVQAELDANGKVVGFERNDVPAGGGSAPAKGDRIEVIDKGGKRFTVPASQKEQAISEGYRLAGA